MPELMNTIMADGPSSSPNQPVKQLFRAWGTWVEGWVAALATNSAAARATKALLDADLSSVADSLRWVMEDPTPANNGIYRKIGASGTGSWLRVGDLPYSFVALVDSGAGTANAIQLTSSIPTSPSVLRTANVYEANTGVVTISENSATAKPLLTASGNQIASGGLKAGMTIAYLDAGTSFRLLSDQASAAIQAAAEAAQVAAEAAAQTAVAAASSVQLTEFATKAAAAAYAPGSAPSMIRIAGYTAAGDGGGALYKKVASQPSHAGKFSITLADAVTVVWYELAEADPRPEMFGAVGDGTTDDTTALAAMLVYAPADTHINLRGKSYKYTTLAISKNVYLRNGKLLCAATTGVQITVDPAARFTARKVKFTGGGSHTTVDTNQNHSLISQIGASTTSRGVGLDLEGCEFSGCGYIPVFSKWCNGHRFVGSKFSDFAYAGFMVLSCDDGVALYNRVEGQDAVGISGDAYGFSITHWSLGYNTDPNAGTPLAANPFCNNWLVMGNTVIAPKIWEGIDFHAGYNNVVAFNKVFGALSGILLGCGSGNAANYAGWNNIITGNTVLASNEDGTAVPGLVAVYGITVQGGSASAHNTVIVTNNIVAGYGGQTASGGVATPNNLVPAININVYVQRLICTGNNVTGWSGSGISISQGAGSAVLDSNMFSGMRDTQASSAVIRFQSDAPGRYSIIGCVLDDTLNAPAFGVVTSSTVKARITYGSDFRRATTEVAGAFTSPGEIRKFAFAA